MSQSSEKKPDDFVQVQEAIRDIYSVDDAPGIDRVYLAKARLLNNAIQDIGMGKYQVCVPSLGFRGVSVESSSAVVALLCCRLWLVRRQSVACRCTLSLR